MELAPKDVAGTAFDEILGADREGLLAELGRLASSNTTADRPRFPGPSPVSIERADFPTLTKQRYFACEKTDGWRAALVVTRAGGRDLCYLVDRALTLFLVYMEQVPVALWQGSLFDGEVVYNLKTQRWSFLCFDAVRVSGIPIYLRPFSERMLVVRQAWAAYVPSIMDTVVFRAKHFVPTEDFGAVAGHIANMSEEFKTDGLVLTPDQGGVVYGRHREMFKLKTKHSIDFLVDTDGRSLRVYDPSTRAHARVGELAAPDPALQGRIVECVATMDGRWAVECVRTDKQEANDMLTYTKTILNGVENITLAELEAVLA